VAILLILLSLFALLWGSGSSSTGSGAATMPRHVTTHSRQSATTHARVTVRASSRTRTSSSCVARVRVKGASVQKQRRCTYLPVSP
jgi:hypothetical protein